MNPDDHPRQSMLSVPARWSELYFDIFFVLCVLGAAFVVCYEIIRRPPDADALDVAAEIIVRMAAVPIASALQAYIIMRARDAIMKTWETYRLERYNKGREDGREEGREDLAREALALLDKREPGEGVEALYEFLSRQMSENGGGKNGKRGENGAR